MTSGKFLEDRSLQITLDMVRAELDQLRDSGLDVFEIALCRTRRNDAPDECYIDYL